MKIYYSHTRTMHSDRRHGRTRTIYSDRLNGFTTKNERDEFCKCIEGAKPITAANAKKFFGAKEYESCKNGAPYAEAWDWK